MTLFPAVMEELKKQLLDSMFNQLQQGMSEMSPEQLARMKDMLAELNQMLEQKARGEEPDFDGFMAGMLAMAEGRLDEEAGQGAPEHQLAAHGRPVAGGTPADVVEAAFRVWGEQAPGRLRGQFAAAVTDGERIWAFRDQVGFRALFYRNDDAGLHLGSEAKQVLAGAGLPREPDVAANRGGLANHVVALDDDPPGIGSQERGEHAHRGRLACAVGSQHAQHGPARHRQVDASERVHLAERLVQRDDFYSVVNALDHHGG